MNCNNFNFPSNFLSEILIGILIGIFSNKITNVKHLILNIKIQSYPVQILFVAKGYDFE